jgi:AhpD family alkylhydroperoxidase
MAPRGRLTGELKRLIAGAASLAAGCRYCQAHAASGALQAGGSAERIADLWNWEKSPRFTPAERAAFAFAQAAATVPNAVDAPIAAELKNCWSEDEIVEILSVISLFGFLNRWNDSMGTSLEDEPAAAAQALLGPGGWTPGKHR